MSRLTTDQGAPAFRLFHWRVLRGLRVTRDARNTAGSRAGILFPQFRPALMLVGRVNVALAHSLTGKGGDLDGSVSRAGVLRSFQTSVQADHNI